MLTPLSDIVRVLALPCLLSLALPSLAGAKAWPLKPGSRGGRVRIVQRALHRPADGVYGSATSRSVRRFQRRHRLGVDGQVGHGTWVALKVALRHGGGHARRAGHRPRTRHHVHHRHHRGHHARRHVQTRGPAVRLVQRRLGLRADGVLGASTARAIRRFQGAHRIHADGVVGPATWRRLGVRGRHAVLRSAAHRHGHHSHHHSHQRGGGLPLTVRRAIAAADRIARAPYRYGGGHGTFHDRGYDCSGTVSYVLHAAHLIGRPRDSSQLMSWGRAGRGRWITVYANRGHTFMVINGRRFDTSGVRAHGSRWQPAMRSRAGYVVRHPAHL